MPVLLNQAFSCGERRTFFVLASSSSLLRGRTKVAKVGEGSNLPSVGDPLCLLYPPAIYHGTHTLTTVYHE